MKINPESVVSECQSCDGTFYFKLLSGLTDTPEFYWEIYVAGPKRVALECSVLAMTS